MKQNVTCTVLFADLRGSTSMYESLGNAAAATIVTQSVAMMSKVVEKNGGAVIKTLGDGLMAVFIHPTRAIIAAQEVQEELERLKVRNAQNNIPNLRMQQALAHGEVIQVAGDCFGDAVNVAARLLDHAGDNETLATAQTLRMLPTELASQFRRLDVFHLRGRLEPVEVWRLDNHASGDSVMATMFGDTAPIAPVPEGLRLSVEGISRIHTARNLPVVLGRSHEATYCIDDSRVSRIHARIEWHSGNFQLTDFSSNGTFVRFGRQAEVVTLRRASCTLHGRGVISLGLNTSQAQTPMVSFEVLRFAETDPQPLD
ncbi:adenylate/guanylate cyclase domain-containing protein [Leptothrix ochracea]|uniref:adenylate/guanylate cyclase domain-containing protein n=1 Tax=Leptothrix ochracea TaxID=735331 RepID=UPI0034E27E47